jgi:microcystin-dependent protein
VSNQRILSNYPIYVKDSAQISSETVSDSQGYRLYMDKTEAHIDSDVVTSRHKIITPKVESSNANNTTGFQLYTEGDASYLNIDHINAREWTPFTRGMIMMFSGLVSEIPEGWAICDGQKHEYKGVVTVTPNLIGKFIKASESSGATGGSNEITISTSNLPEHSHPHSHSISGTRITIESSANLNMKSSSEFVTDVSFDTTQVSNSSGESFTEVISYITPASENVHTTGGVHTHTATIVEGTIADSKSTEQAQQWDNAPINIEPEYYALIFIIKL